MSKVDEVRRQAKLSRAGKGPKAPKTDEEETSTPVADDKKKK